MSHSGAYANAYYHRTKEQRKAKLQQYNKTAYAKYKNDPAYVARKQEYRDARKDLVKAYNEAYRRDHKGCGLSKAQYDQMAEEQEHMCLICGKVKKLVVDHDHKTNKVRGLLCVSCNFMLGYAYDNVNFLINAATYLRR